MKSFATAVPVSLLASLQNAFRITLAKGERTG